MARKDGTPNILVAYEHTPAAIAFNATNVALLVLFGLLTVYPFVRVLSNSMSSFDAISSLKVWLLPVDGPDFWAYGRIFQSPLMMGSYLNTIYYSLSGVAMSLLLLSLTAYPLAIKGFYLRKPLTIAFAITMFFSGGLIPTYLVVRGVGFLNTVWALIIPDAISVFYLIILRTNFQMIPESLRESAQMDGANHLRILFTIILPLARPILAALFLFIIVQHWNSFFAPLIYINELERQPLQVILRDLLVRVELSSTDVLGLQGGNELALMEMQFQPGMVQAIRNAAIMVAVGPILLVYPFVQKYFVKGRLIGAIKE